MSVSEVFAKYAQRIKNPSEYKLYSHAGDTVNFYGWFYLAHSRTDTTFYTDKIYQMDKIPIGGCNVHLDIDIDESAFYTLDVRKEGFVTGILQFPENVPQSQQCFTMPFSFKVIGIHN